MLMTARTDSLLHFGAGDVSVECDVFFFFEKNNFSEEVGKSV
jgi:hypothetical protein